MRPASLPFLAKTYTTQHLPEHPWPENLKQDEVRASIDGQVQAKRSGGKPLDGEAASVRTAKPSTSMSSAQTGSDRLPFKPALTVATMMGRVMVPMPSCLLGSPRSVSHRHLV